MREEDWQALVAQAVAEHFAIPREHVFHEVPTRDGSRVDLLAVCDGRLIAVELKVAEVGEVAAALDARAQRQLRHFRAASHELYLVTLAAPRSFEWTPEGQVLARPPVEGQLLPEGVGWMAFDMLTRTLHLLRPSTRTTPVDADRRHVVDHLLGRLARVTNLTRSMLVPA